MKKYLSILSAAILLFSSCQKQITKADANQTSASSLELRSVKHSLTTSLKGVMSGLVNRDFAYIQNNMNFYNNSSNLSNNRLAICNGIVVRVFWKDLQSSYDGAITSNNAIDSLIKFANDSSQFNIQIKIRVYGGTYAPDFVKSCPSFGGGTKGIVMQTTDENGNPLTDVLPAYWDNGYIDAYKKFMTKLGSKYDTCQNVLEVTGAIGDITTVEPFLIKCGTPNTLSYNTSNPLWVNANNLYTAGLTTQNQSYAIRRGIALMDSCWKYTHISLAFSPLQVLTCNNPGSINKNYTISQNLDSTKSIIDYFVIKNGLKGVLGNNGLRDAATSSAPEDWVATPAPGGILYQMSNYMENKLFIGTNRICYLYFQTAQPSLMGDFTNTLDAGIGFKADMIEVPYLTAPQIPNSEVKPVVLKDYDTKLNGQLP